MAKVTIHDRAITDLIVVSDSSILMHVAVRVKMDGSRVQQCLALMFT